MVFSRLNSGAIKMIRIILKSYLRFFSNLVWVLSPASNTWITQRVLKKLGVKVAGELNYVSALVWFDGDRYDQITLGHGVTISSNVRLLTHDWSPYTVARSLLGDDVEVKGAKRPISLGDYVFVGTGSIVMPGATIGRGSIIGAGSVVRGAIPEYSIVVGSPGEIVGDSRDIVRKVYGS